MKHFRSELHLWRTEGVVCREDELCNKHTALKWCTLRASEGREGNSTALAYIILHGNWNLKQTIIQPKIVWVCHMRVFANE